MRTPENFLNLSRLRILVLCVLGVVAASVGAKNTYFIGNSVTDSVNYSDYQVLVQSEGESVSWARHIILGSPLDNIWNNPTSGFLSAPYGGYANALPNYDWDVVSLQTYDRNFASDRASIGNFINLTLEHPYNEQNTVFYIMGRWPRQDKGEYQDYWVLENDGTTARSETADFFADLVTAVRSDFPGTPVRMVPVGHIYYELDIMMEAGLVPGFTDITQFYSDGVHQNDYGRYTTIVAYYTTLYGNDPRGMATTGLDVDPTVAAIIQEVAWVVVNDLSEYTGVDAGGDLEITTSFLPVASTGRDYSYALRAIFGERPYSWSIVSGNLPTGFTFSADGLLSGQSAAPGSYPLTFRVTDNTAATREVSITLDVVVNTPPEITTTSLPAASQGSRFDVQLERINGEGPFSWSLASGRLPDGMTLSPLGRLAGTPWKTGSYTFSVQVADSDDPAETDTQEYTVNVGAPSASTVLVSRTLAPVVLDGVLSEAEWPSATTITRVAAGSPGAAASFRTLWNLEGLYIAVEVNDASASTGDATFAAGDAVEILVDSLHDREAVYNADDREFLFGRNGAYDEFFNRRFGVRHAVTSTASGYTMEVLIPWTNLDQSPSEGLGLGLDVIVHDAGTDGTRTGALTWQQTDPAELSPAVFGNLMLAKATTGATASSGLLAYEPFAEVNQSLHAFDRAAGLQSWDVQNAGTTSSFRVTDGLPLGFGDHRNQGELLTHGYRATGGDSYKSSGVLFDVTGSFSKYASGSAIAADGTLWVSWLARAEVGNAPARFQLSSGGIAWVGSDAQVRVQVENGKWALSVGGATSVDTGVAATTNQTFFFVLKLELGAANDTVSLFINPDALGGSAPAQPAISVVSPTSLSITRLHWYPGQSAGNASLDEVRIGTTYASVTPVRPKPPVIDVQPQGGDYAIGDAASLTVDAFSRTVASYQWFKDGAPIEGANAAMLEINSLTASDFGTYQVEVTNDAGETRSDSVTLTEMIPPPSPGYGSWQSTISWNTPDDGLAGANPDNDFYTNFEEYILRLNPLVADAPSSSLASIQQGVGGLDMTFGPVRYDADLDYTIEVSTNLEGWSALSPEDWDSTVTDDQIEFTLIRIAPAGTTPEFFRLSVE